MSNKVDPKFIAELKTLGVVWYDLMLPETKALPGVMHPNEKILGLVYGRYTQQRDGVVSRGVLVSTDQRVILLNKKPMFKQTDEISYDVISGVNYSKVGFMGTVSLHTRIGEIHVRTFNHRCAYNFVEAIESKVFKP